MAVCSFYLEAEDEGSPQSCWSLTLQSVEKDLNPDFTPTETAPERLHCFPGEKEGPEWVLRAGEGEVVTSDTAVSNQTTVVTFYENHGLSFLKILIGFLGTTCATWGH